MTEASNEEEDWDQLNAEGPEDPTEDGTPEESYHSDDEEVRQKLLFKVAVSHVCICLAPDAGTLMTRTAQIWACAGSSYVRAAASLKQAQTSAVEPVKTPHCLAAYKALAVVLTAAV